MAYWTYKCYDDGKTPNLWRRWYDEQDSRVRGKHDAVFEILATQDHWAQPHYKQLSDGLAEITLKGNVQWRIFGVADFHRKLFTVAGIGFHKSDVYSPRKIMETCRKRIKEIGLDKRKAIACEKPE